MSTHVSGIAKNRAVIVAVIYTLVATLLTIILFHQVQVLTLRRSDISGELQYFALVKPGDKITLQFLHSYERGWVEEIYRVDAGNFIYPVEHRFQVFSYDARENTYPGDFHMGDDGFAYVSNIDKYLISPIRAWRILVAYEVPQILIVKDRPISLPDLMPSGSSVTLRVERWYLHNFFLRHFGF